MHRPSLRVVLGIIILLTAGCSSRQVDVNREALDPGEYQVVYLIAEYDDPLKLGASVREAIEKLGYRVVPGGAEGPGKEGLILSYDYETAPDLNREGRVSRRMKWFRLRLTDNADGSEVAAGEVVSGFMTRSPREEAVELVTAMMKRLRSGESASGGGADITGSGSGGEEVRREADTAQVNEPARSSASHPEKEMEARKQEEVYKEEPVNPWMPRLKSWGFEEWGREE